MGEAMARYKHDELTAGEAVSIILEQAKRLSRPMEAVAWRETTDDAALLRLANEIYRQVAPLVEECSEPNPEDYVAAILQALAVIPAEGLGSSLRDTRRAEDRAVVAEKEPDQ
jgi:hypothetical protein